MGKMPSAPNAHVFLTLTLDNSYVTGGYAFDAQQEFRAKGGYDHKPVLGELFVTSELKAGYSVEYVDDALVANRKLKVLVPAGTEVPNATDLSVTPGTIRLKLSLLG